MNNHKKHTILNFLPSLNNVWWLSGVLLFLFANSMFAQGTQTQQLNPCNQRRAVVYSVDIGENEGNGSTNSIYDWTILEQEFSGQIYVLTSSGNKIEVAWQDTPSGTYTLQVIETNLITGCEGDPQLLDVELDIPQEISEIVGPDTLCENSTAVYSHNLPDGFWSIENDSGLATVNNNGEVTAEKEGEVTLIYTVIIGICEYSTEKTIYINPLPEVLLEDAYLCINSETGEVNNPALLDAQVNGDNLIFTWYYNDKVFARTQASQLEVLKVGEYSVQVKNTETGCLSEKVSATVSKSVMPKNASVSVTKDFDDRQLVEVTMPNSGNYQYSFNGGPFQTSNTFSVDVLPGTYPIEIINEGACNSLTIEVTIINYPKFFTPNQDGHNDLWNITSLRGDYSAVIYVFDRYGKLLTSFKPKSRGWDGTYHGKQMPANDYWFLVEYTDKNNNVPREFRANFTLKR
ncbi:T9SS type B sorting domain-containing protein [Mesonia aquimarina]|uniref:T9SS type B sorting domain-containing protein n=1 Tax=Mesonia aquimarina TaxID=1504967 RepID=UPI000EF5F2C4|nr:T9SS type B sorting domain-containing protein [Mesonia aquimarina]